MHGVAADRVAHRLAADDGGAELAAPSPARRRSRSGSGSAARAGRRARSRRRRATRCSRRRTGTACPSSVAACPTRVTNDPRRRAARAAPDGAVSESGGRDGRQDRSGRPHTGHHQARCGIGVAEVRAVQPLAASWRPGSAASAPGPGASTDAGVAFADRRTTARAHDERVPAHAQQAQRQAPRARRPGRAGRMLDRTERCLWGARGQQPSYVGGCSFAPRVRARFSYRWSAATATLTLDYRVAGARLGGRDAACAAELLRPAASRSRTAVTTLEPRPSSRRGSPATRRRSSAGYAPNVLPGVVLAPAVLLARRQRRAVLSVALGVRRLSRARRRRGHLSRLLRLARAAARRCSSASSTSRRPRRAQATSFCLVHEFQTWIKRGATWTSPIVRIRVGETAEQSILAYRHDNGIDAYPSLAEQARRRASRRYARGAADQGESPAAEAVPRAGRRSCSSLPSPLLLHPVGFQAGGHDTSDPDFLPPDPRFGHDRRLQRDDRGRARGSATSSCPTGT